MKGIFNYLNKSNIIFSFVFLSTTSAYIVFEWPGAINIQFLKYFSQKYTPRQSEYIYGAVFDLISLPGIVSTIIFGSILDKYGIKIMTTIVFSFIFIGNIIFTKGIISKEFIYLLFGRLITGIGLDAVIVVGIHYSVVLYEKKYLTLAQSIFFTALRSSPLFYMLITPYVSNLYGVQGAAEVGFLAGAACYFFGLLPNFFTIEEEDNKSDDEDTIPTLSFKNQIKSFPPIFWVIILLTAFGNAIIYTFNFSASRFIVEKWLILVYQG